MLNLPEDAERFVDDFDDLRRSGVYCLMLERPDNIPSEWDRQFDTRPPWFSRFVEADEVAYVGSAVDVLRRLNEHDAGEKRLTVLTEVCEIDSLRNIWWFPDDDREGLEFEERKSARLLRREKPNWFVRQA